MKRFPEYIQVGAADCGVACLKMVCEYYGKYFDLHFLRDRCKITKSGVSLFNISEAAEELGLKTLTVKIDKDLLYEAVQEYPLILHWRNEHFVVIYAIRKNWITRKKTYYISDPAIGHLTFNEEEFLNLWLGNARLNYVELSEENAHEGYALVAERTSNFDQQKSTVTSSGKNKLAGLNFLFTTNRKIIVKVAFTFILSLILLFLSPFIAQSLIDKGVSSDSITFINALILAQAVVLVCTFVNDIVRNWLMLFLSSQVFIKYKIELIKHLMYVKVNYFNRFKPGDVISRIAETEKIEHFIQDNAINALLSFIIMIFFSITLAIQSLSIFIIMFIGLSLAFLWIVYLLKPRRKIESLSWELVGKTYDHQIEIIDSINDIKIANAYQQKREAINVLLYNALKRRQEQLRLYNRHTLITKLIVNATLVIVNLISARQVVMGQITIGQMIAVTVIISQFAVSFDQLINFMRSLQDAKLALERLNDIEAEAPEIASEDKLIKDLPRNKTISFQDVWFYYGSEKWTPTLESISFSIEDGKTTALVGSSGSGKTTLLNLLLKFEKVNKGIIRIGELSIENIHPNEWRSNIGVVLQDGKLTSGTIAENIALGQQIDLERITYAAKMACVDEFIDILPRSYNTEVGFNGSNLSQGQKQRVLLARAIYKNPQYFFLDEATSALDGNVEKKITENLSTFFKGKTVMIIAHRLSTIVNADKIIVLDRGKIIETGTHSSLLEQKDYYYNLVKNQLHL